MIIVNTIYVEKGYFAVGKFVRLEVIETDNDGYLALKGFLPEGCIVWCRSVGKKVIIKLKDDVDISAIVQQFNLVYDTLNP